MSRITLTIVVSAKTSETYLVEVPPGATIEDVVAAAPVRAEMSAYAELGKRVDAVDGMPADDERGQRFWLLDVNGSRSERGASYQRVRDGDEIRLLLSDDMSTAAG